MGVMRYLSAALWLCVFLSCAGALAKDLLVFGAEWCPSCAQLKAAIEKDPSLVDGFEVSIIDIEQEPQLAKTYDVKTVPLLIVLHRDGTLRRKVGFSGAADLKAWLQKQK